MIEAGQSKRKINYTSIELYPIDLFTAIKLNYPEILIADRDIFIQLHDAIWEVHSTITEHFILKKIKADIRLYEFKTKFDLIYFDAFSPKVQAELWTFEIFQKLFESMNNGGILTTYCAKGQVRRDMIKAGFTIEKLEGPGQKREITRARI